MLLFSFESVVNNLLFLDRQRPTAFRGSSTLVSMAAANRPSLEQVKTEWGLTATADRSVHRSDSLAAR